MRHLSILFLFLLILTGCKEEPDEPEEPKYPTLEDYLGTWANTVTLEDTLIWNEDEVLRYDIFTNTFKLVYSFELFKDSVRVNKIRGYFVGVEEQEFKIALSEDKTILTIEGFDQFYPNYPGYVYNRVNP
ncbi:MAG: hypothetical protein K9H26_14175 [Prolixibacteraceae bacterium]|nr:hypothetical protein [Prolixibacteraceae bacterium]